MVRVGSFSLNEQTTEDPEQQQQQLQQQPAAQQPVATNEVKVGNVTVKVEQVDQPAAFDQRNINGVLRTGVGVQLVFTFTANGQPVTGATVTETVVALQGDPITQNNTPVPLDSQGRGSDFVTNSDRTPTTRAARQKLYAQVTSAFITKQKATFTLTLKSGKRFEITHIRTLTNQDPQGALNPMDSSTGTPRYTFTTQSLTAKAVPVRRKR